MVPTRTTQSSGARPYMYDQATQLIAGKTDRSELNATDARVSVLEASSVGELK